MTDVNMNFEGVRGTITNLEASLENLQTLMQGLNSKKEALSSFWEAQEAATFCEKVAHLSTMLDNFKQKNTDYLLFLYSAISAYEDDAQSLVDSINAIGTEY